MAKGGSGDGRAEAVNDAGMAAVGSCGGGNAAAARSLPVGGCRGAAPLGAAAGTSADGGAACQQIGHSGLWGSLVLGPFL